ncbi:hypothetical protein NPIL_60181, partial [Nephila pilipes]
MRRRIFKFPALLPANDVVVKLIREEHKKAVHAGSYILLSRLRESFWIIKAKKSSEHASDLMKMTGAPVIHVNGDHPE